MNDQFAYGATLFLTALCGGTAVARWYVTPPREPGRHTAAALGGPRVEAQDRFEAYCPAEARHTQHVRLRLGGELCVECRTRDHAGGTA